MEKYKNKEFLGKISIKSVDNGGQQTEERELTKYTYGQIFEWAVRTGSFLKQNKMDYTEKGGMKVVGIFSKNRY